MSPGYPSLSPHSKETALASRPTSDTPPSDDGTPDALRRLGIDDGSLFWDRFGQRLVTWARANLRHANVHDLATAEDVAMRVVVKLKGKWTFDAAEGSLRAYLWQAVANEVQQELRARQRRPGDYGAAPADADWLKALEESFSAGFADLDSAWHRQERARVRAAIRRIRERVTLLEWEVFRLKEAGTPAKRTAAAVAELVNARFRPPRPLTADKVYPTVYKVRAAFHEEFRNAGIDPTAADPAAFIAILRDELGVTEPPPGDSHSPAAEA